MFPFSYWTDMCSVGRAGEWVTDVNTHPDGDFRCAPFVVLKMLWRQFHGVDWNFPVQHTERASHTFRLTCVEYFNSWSQPSTAGQIKAMIVISECHWRIKDICWFNTCGKWSLFQLFWQYIMSISSETNRLLTKGGIYVGEEQVKGKVFLKWQSLTHCWLTPSPKMSAALFKHLFWSLHLSCTTGSSRRQYHHCDNLVLIKWYSWETCVRL